MNYEELLIECEKLKKENDYLRNECIRLRHEVPMFNARGAGRKSSFDSSMFNKVIELKHAGYTYREISIKTGLSKSYVAKIVKREGY